MILNRNQLHADSFELNAFLYSGHDVSGKHNFSEWTPQTALRSYRTLQVLSSLYNTSLSAFGWPSFVLTNLSCHTLCIYICVTSIHEMNPFASAFYFIWASMWSIMVLVVYPYVGKIKENSMEFLVMLKGQAVTKSDRMVVMALRPLGARVGEFFVVNKTTALTIIVIVSNLTTNALLLL